MKRSNHPGEVALILAAALCAFTPGLAAQSGDNAQQPGQQQQGQQQNKAFTGKIDEAPKRTVCPDNRPNGRGQISRALSR